MKTIQDYEIIGHGLMWPCYFQGCGTVHTDFTDVATGIGSSEHEALMDALDSLAQNDWDTSTIHDSLSQKDEVNDWIRENFPDVDDAEPIDIETPYVYVSIRVR